METHHSHLTNPVPDDMLAFLGAELGDTDIAARLTAILVEDALRWRASGLDPGSIDTLIAFSFGNEIMPNGNRQPGRVNFALADIAVQLHKVRGARIFAQWEIAEAIGKRIPDAALISIFPARDSRSEPRYLSTEGVAAAIAGMTTQATDLGNVGVVAFADHMYRCVTTARAHGFEAFAPKGVDMPCDYDPKSGQPWCRTRIAYLLHDIMLRIKRSRAAAMGESVEVRPW